MTPLGATEGLKPDLNSWRHWIFWKVLDVSPSCRSSSSPRSSVPGAASPPAPTPAPVSRLSLLLHLLHFYIINLAWLDSSLSHERINSFGFFCCLIITVVKAFPLTVQWHHCLHLWDIEDRCLHTVYANICPRIDDLPTQAHTKGLRADPRCSPTSTWNCLSLLLNTSLLSCCLHACPVTSDLVRTSLEKRDSQK